MRLPAALFVLVLLPFALAACGDDDPAGGGAKSFSKAEQVIDPARRYTATFTTSKGEFAIELYADQSPKTVNSFVFLAQQGFFDGLKFHRVVKDFVIQAGDPTASGSGGPGYETQDEPNELSNKRGTIAMAKTSGAKVFGSQFFVNLKDNTALDYNNPTNNKFYPFGVVVSGMDVVDAIGNSPASANGKPAPAITIESVRIEVQ